MLWGFGSGKTFFRLESARDAVMVFSVLFFVSFSMATVERSAWYGKKEKRQRDFSLRRPTLSQERKRKKKSACSVRNDGGGVRFESGGFLEFEFGGVAEGVEDAAGNTN
jgi:hypothetical protein